MELYNQIIRKAEGSFGTSAPRRYDYNPQKAWKDTGEAQLVMLRDAAFELGGDNKPSANFSCVTTDESLVQKDEILLYGPDLPEIRGSVPFARLAFVLAEEIKVEDKEDTEPVFRAIQDIDFVKYHVHPEGYMVRTSSDNHREQVRVSTEAVRRGISFEAVGNDYISRYKKNPLVKAVKMVFLTAPDADYASLLKDAKDVHDVTLTLSKILEGMPTDCGSCTLKPICDEVEGMKELHFGQKK